MSTGADVVEMGVRQEVSKCVGSELLVPPPSNTVLVRLARLLMAKERPGQLPRPIPGLVSPDPDFDLSFFPIPACVSFPL